MVRCLFSTEMLILSGERFQMGITSWAAEREEEREAQNRMGVSCARSTVASDEYGGVLGIWI